MTGVFGKVKPQFPIFAGTLTRQIDFIRCYLYAGNLTRTIA